ncbi:MAG: NAD-dependent epimerase/dehydratase family protein [Desulfobacteraceae bacterium]|nr:NAD-dependent epimerase/dehydratase family protein [Desulfobacteraceae bacterium]
MIHSIIKKDVANIIKIVGQDLNRLQGKRLLITGGTGFIGTWLLETILQLNKNSRQPCKVYVPTRNPEAFVLKAPHLASNPDIVLLHGDIADFRYPDDDCNFIIHAAAPAEPKALIHDSLGVAETIVRGTRRVLELAVQKNVEGFLFISSGAVYGVQPPDLEKITERYSGAPDITNIKFAYGEAKRYAEMLCVLYHRQHGLPVHIARPFTFVGPYQDLNAGFAITDFIRDGLKGKPLLIQGDGTTIRSYCYAGDLTAMLWKILLQSPVGGIYNVGSDESISILELANKIVSFLDIPVEIKIMSKQNMDSKPARYVPSLECGRSELGMGIYTNIDKAIQRALSWIKNV